MEETAVLKRAQEYILSLARGFDPLSGEEITDDSIINNVRMSRCFFYVADVLGQVIENDSNVNKTDNKKQAKRPVRNYTYLTNEQIANFKYTKRSIGIKNLLKELQNTIGDDNYIIAASQVTNWLTKEGYLAENIVSGKRKKVATAQGNAIGISVQAGTDPSNGKPYKMNVYNMNAQQFIIENYNLILDEVLNSEEEK